MSLIFVGVLKVTEEKSWIRIRKDPRIRIRIKTAKIRMWVGGERGAVSKKDSFPENESCLRPYFRTHLRPVYGNFSGLV
jgi:hypothetical protein